MAEDETLVKNEVCFPGRSYHRGVLIGTRKRLGFLDLHLDVAALETAGAGLVAEHLGATLFAHVTLTEHVSHLKNSSFKT
jgi:hypothetical protein